MTVQKNPARFTTANAARVAKGPQKALNLRVENKADANAADFFETEKELGAARGSLLERAHTPEGREALATALDGKTVVERTTAEQIIVDELILQEIGVLNTVTVRVVPQATLADIKAGKAPATTLPKGVDAAYIPGKNVILVREGLSPQARKAAVTEELGERLGELAEARGIKLAPGDVGARVLKTVNKETLTKSDFDAKASDTAFVRYEGKTVKAKARAAGGLRAKSSTVQVDFSSSDHLTVQYQDSAGRWKTIAQKSNQVPDANDQVDKVIGKETPQPAAFDKNTKFRVVLKHASDGSVQTVATNDLTKPGARSTFEIKTDSDGTQRIFFNSFGDGKIVGNPSWLKTDQESDVTVVLRPKIQPAKVSAQPKTPAETFVPAHVFVPDNRGDITVEAYFPSVKQWRPVFKSNNDRGGFVTRGIDVPRAGKDLPKLRIRSGNKVFSSDKPGEARVKTRDGYQEIGFETQPTTDKKGNVLGQFDDVIVTVGTRTPKSLPQVNLPPDVQVGNAIERNTPDQLVQPLPGLTAAATTALLKLLNQGKPIMTQNLTPLIRRGVVKGTRDGKLQIDLSKLSTGQNAKLAQDVLFAFDPARKNPAQLNTNMARELFEGLGIGSKENQAHADAVGNKDGKTDVNEVVTGFATGELSFKSLYGNKNPAAKPQSWILHSRDISGAEGISASHAARMLSLIVGKDNFAFRDLAPLVRKGIVTPKADGSFFVSFSKMPASMVARLLSGMGRLESAPERSGLMKSLGLPAIREEVVRNYPVAGAKTDDGAFLNSMINAVQDGFVVLKKGKIQLSNPPKPTPESNQIDRVAGPNDPTPRLADPRDLTPRFMITRAQLHKVADGRHTDKTSYEYYDPTKNQWVTIVGRMNGRDGKLTGFAKPDHLVSIPLFNGKPPAIRLANWSYGTEERPSWGERRRIGHGQGVGGRRIADGWNRYLQYRPKGPDGKEVDDNFMRAHNTMLHAHTDSGGYEAVTQVQTNNTGRGQRPKYKTVTQHRSPKVYTLGVPRQNEVTGAWGYDFYSTGNANPAGLSTQESLAWATAGAVARALPVVGPVAGAVVGAGATLRKIIDFFDHKPGSKITANSDGTHNWFDGGNLNISRATDGYKDYTLDYKIYYSEKSRPALKPTDKKPPNYGEIQAAANGKTSFAPSELPAIMAKLGFSFFKGAATSKFTEQDAIDSIAALSPTMTPGSLARLIRQGKIRARPNGTWSLSPTGLNNKDRARIAHSILNSGKSDKAKAEQYQRMTGQTLTDLNDRLRKDYGKTDVTFDQLIGLFEQPDVPSEHLFNIAPPSNLPKAKLAVDDAIKMGKAYSQFIKENFAEGAIIKSPESKKKVKAAEAEGLAKAQKKYDAAVASGKIKASDPWRVNMDVAVDLQFFTGGKPWGFGRYAPTMQNRVLARFEYQFGGGKPRTLKKKVGVIWWRDRTIALHGAANPALGQLGKVGPQLRHGAFYDLESGAATLSTFYGPTALRPYGPTALRPYGPTINNVFNRGNFGEFLQQTKNAAASAAGSVVDFVQNRVLGMNTPTPQQPTPDPDAPDMPRPISGADHQAETRRRMDIEGGYESETTSWFQRASDQLGKVFDVNIRAGVGYSVTYDLNKVLKSGADFGSLLIPMVAEGVASTFGTVPRRIR